MKTTLFSSQNVTESHLWCTVCWRCWKNTNILNVLTLLPLNMSPSFILVCRLSALDSEIFCLYTKLHLLHKTISRHAYVYLCLYTCITHVYTCTEPERRFGDWQDSPTWIFFPQTKISCFLWKKKYCFLGGKKEFLFTWSPVCMTFIELDSSSAWSTIIVKFVVWHGISELLEPWEQTDTVKPQIPKSAKVK